MVGNRMEAVQNKSSRGGMEGERLGRQGGGEWEEGELVDDGSEAADMAVARQHAFVHQGSLRLHPTGSRASGESPFGSLPMIDSRSSHAS